MSNQDRAYVFGFPASFRYLMCGGGGLFLGAAIVAYYSPNLNDPNAALLPPTLVGFAAFCAVCGWFTAGRIEIDEESILSARPGQATTRIAWRDVRDIRDRPILSWLEVHGPSGERIRILNVLENYVALRAEVRWRCSGLECLAPDSPEVRIVCRSYQQLTGVGFSLVLFLGGAFGGAIAGSIFIDILVGILIGILTLGVGVFALWSTSWHTLIVDRDAMTMKRVFRVRRILYREIRNVWVEQQMTEMSGVTIGGELILFLMLRDDTKLPLEFTFPRGPEHLRDTILRRVDLAVDHSSTPD